jgi:hypothetical protein
VCFLFVHQGIRGTGTAAQQGHVVIREPTPPPIALSGEDHCESLVQPYSTDLGYSFDRPVAGELEI